MDTSKMSIEQKRARLAVLFKQRRLTLRHTQDSLSEVASVSESTIRRIETGGSTELRERSMTRLENALGWEQGSIETVLAGGDPTVIPRSAYTIQKAEREVHRSRMADILDDTDDPVVADAAMRAAEAAARAVVDALGTRRRRS